jgi:3-oxoacyl-[acyl-carrier protein] reductase
MFMKRAVIVTGASVGIGRATAKAFGREGDYIIVGYVNDKAGAELTRRSIMDSGGKAEIFKADVSREEETKALVNFCVATYGCLDILINNAGITEFIPFSDLDSATAEVWDKLYRTNVEGAFFCSREAAKVMKQHNGGSIVLLASRAGLGPVGSSLPYSVSKAAVIHLTKCLAVTLGPEIRVNCISPGAIDNTRWNKACPNYDHEQYLVNSSKAAKLGRVGQPDDIANAIVFITSEKASYCTGSVLTVDGGSSLA